MSLARVGWTVALVALAACGGGGSAAGGARGTFVPPAQVGSTSPPTPSSATSTATYTSAGATIAFPSAGGYSGTIKLPISGMLSVATMTMTTSTAIPGGFPTILDRRTAGRRYTLSSVLAPQLYETLNSSDSVVFNAFPTISFTVPASQTVSASAFYLSLYDPTLAVWTDLGRMSAYRQTLSSLVYTMTTFSMHGNLNYLFAMYSFPIEHPTSSFASSSCSKPSVAAVSSNDVLWCGAGSGFEKITSSGSSFISLPNTAYTVEGMTRGPDGNAWFTAESTARTLGQLALYGEIDETSGTVTTYAVPNPSSFASSEVSYQIGAITSGPSSLYFQTGVGAEAFVETGDTSGNVTQSVKLYYVNSAGLSLAYASDGNVWVVTGPFGTSGTASGEESFVTKVTLSGGTTTNYAAPACPAPRSNLVQGGDGNLYILASNGLCTVTTSGVATFTPISPYLQLPIDLTVATDGSVWYAVPKGVGRIYGGTIVQYSDPALHDVSQGVFALPNGTLWEIGTFPSSEMVQVLNPSSP